MRTRNLNMTDASMFFLYDNCIVFVLYESLD